MNESITVQGHGLLVGRCNPKKSFRRQRWVARRSDRALAERAGDVVANCRAVNKHRSYVWVLGMMLAIVFGCWSASAASKTPPIAQFASQGSSWRANSDIRRGINLGYALEFGFQYPTGCVDGKTPEGQAGDAKTNTSPDEKQPQRHVKLLTTTDFWESLSSNNLFDSVRIPVAWARYSCSDGRIDPGYLALVRRIVKHAMNAGFVVVLDFHKFKKVIRNPNRFQVEFLAYWRQIAQAFADRNDRLYFDLLNEPPVGDKDCESVWPDLLVEAVSSIRAAGRFKRTRLLLIAACNPNDYKHIKLLAGAIKKLKDSPSMNPLIDSFHYYDPDRSTQWRIRCQRTKLPAECAGERGRKEPSPLDGLSKCDHLPRKGKHPSDCWSRNIKNRLSKASERFSDMDLATNLEEAGFERSHKVDTPHIIRDSTKRRAVCTDRIRWTLNTLANAEILGMSWTYWNLFGSFGIVGSDGKINKDAMLLRVIAKIDAASAEVVPTPDQQMVDDICRAELS